MARKKAQQKSGTELKTQPVNESTVPVKKKRHWVPNPQTNFGEENVKPGDNARYLRFALAAWDLPPIDIADPAQVEARIIQYFEHCMNHDMKPNVKGMANWLGVDRSTVALWKRGDFRSATHMPIIQKAYDLMEEQWIDYMQNGKINPASGIFLAKNLYGYRDVIDIAPTQAPPLGEMQDKKALEARILEAVVDEDIDDPEH